MPVKRKGRGRTGNIGPDVLSLFVRWLGHCMRQAKGTAIYVVVFVCLFFAEAIPAHAEDQTDWMAVVFGFGSDESIQGIMNGTLLDVDGTTIVISGYLEAWENSSLLVACRGSDASAVEISLLANDESLGVAIFQAKGSLGGCGADTAVSCSTLAAGSQIYYGGLDYMEEVTVLSDCIVLLEGQIYGQVQINDCVYMQMTEAFDEILTGGPVFSDQGLLVGFLVDVGDGSLFMPVDYFLDLTESGQSGSTSGGQGSSDQGSSDGDTGDSGSSGSQGSSEGGFGSGGSGTIANISAETSPVLSTYFLVATALALFVFVVSLIIYNKREMQVQSGQAEEFPNLHLAEKVESKIAAMCMIRGVSGYFQGHSFLVAANTVTFGRDAAKCTVAYPTDTRGVSGIHCRVEYSGSKLYLTDLGSTYGTYLIDGTRLKEHVAYELHSGDQFYLAEKRNLFLVR